MNVLLLLLLKKKDILNNIILQIKADNTGLFYSEMRVKCRSRGLDTEEAYA